MPIYLPNYPSNVGGYASGLHAGRFGITPSDTVIDFCGDSITEGWLDSAVPPNPNLDQRWQKGLEANITAALVALGGSAPTYNNNGVGGQTTTAMSGSTQTNIVIGHKPTHVFALSSVNDPANNITPATTGANYETWAQAIWAALPGTRLHIVSNVFWGGNTFTSELVPDSSNPHSAAVIATNAGIKAWCATHPDNVEYIDIRTPIVAYEAAFNTGNVPNGFLTQSSGTHISTLGQALFSLYVWKAISVVA